MKMVAGGRLSVAKRVILVIMAVVGLVGVMAGIVAAAPGDTTRVSVSSSGEEGNNDSFCATMSGDGRYVVFDSAASNLVAGDTNGNYDVFVRDKQMGTTERVSVSGSGAQANGCSGIGSAQSISADGRYVVFRMGAGGGGGRRYATWGRIPDHPH